MLTWIKNGTYNVFLSHLLLLWYHRAVVLCAFGIDDFGEFKGPRDRG